MSHQQLPERRAPDATVQTMILSQLTELNKDQREGFAGLRAEMHQQLDKLVTRDAFEAEKTRVDLQHSALVTLVTREQDLREKADQELSHRIDGLSGTLKWVAASIVIPVGLFLANLLFARGVL